MLTVGQLKRVLNGLPDEQSLMVLDEDGFAAEIAEVHPQTITDANPKGLGTVLLLEFEKTGAWFGFDPETKTQIDTSDD